jgi:hypothetical protein
MDTSTGMVGPLTDTAGVHLTLGLRLLLGTLPQGCRPICGAVPGGSSLSFSHTWRKGEVANAAAQPPDAAPSATVPIEGQMSEEEMDKGAEKDFQAVLRHGPDVEVSFPESCRRARS